MYVRLSLENGSTALVDHVFFCVHNCQVNVCLGDIFLIKRKFGWYFSFWIKRKVIIVLLGDQSCLSDQISYFCIAQICQTHLLVYFFGKKPSKYRSPYVQHKSRTWSLSQRNRRRVWEANLIKIYLYEGNYLWNNWTDSKIRSKKDNLTIPEWLRPCLLWKKLFI